MSAISLKSITGITSITTPAGVDNQLTLHNNNTTEAVKLDTAGNLHFHNHLSITGVSTAANFKTGTSNLHNTGLNVFDLDVDGHTNLDNVSIAGITTTTENIRIQGNNKYLTVGASNQIGVVHTGGEAFITNSSGHFTHRSDVHKWENFAGSSEYLRITSAGKVGINTVSPGRQMHIFSGSSGHPVILERGDTSNTQIEMKTGGATRGYMGCSTTANFMVYDNDASDIQFVVNQTGKVGIGTNSPSFFTHIQGDGVSNDVLKITARGSGQMVRIQNYSNTNSIVRFANYLGNSFWDVQYNTNNSFSLDYGDSQKFSITSSGSAAFTVGGGNVQIDATGAYGLSIHNNNSPSMGHLFIFGDNGLIRFRNSSSVYTARIGYNDSSNTLYFENQEGGNTLSILADGAKLSDNKKFLCGNDNDLEIYHNNSNAYIKNATGYSMYRSGQHVFENSNGATEMLRIKSDGRIGINANPSVNHEYLHIKPVGNNVLDLRYELNSDTDIRHKFYDNTGTQRGTFGYTTYANSTDYPNFHDSFYFQTDPLSNGTLANSMRISREGAFILPRQPCFSVVMSNDYSSSTSHTANFDTKRFDQGDNFNTGSNGIFTAPVTGKYYMHAAIQTQSGGDTQIHIMGVGFLVNGSIQTSKGSGDQYLGRGSTHYMTVHAIRILNLAQGDTVQVYILLHAQVSIEGSGGVDRCNWQGYLMA